MRQFGLALVLVVGATSAALAQQAAQGAAQQSAQGSAQVSNPNSSVVQPGLVKPPAGMAQSGPSKMQPGTTPALPNNPTVSQLAKQSGPTIGSPVPVQGPGGTTTTTYQSGQQASGRGFWNWLMNKL